MAIIIPSEGQNLAQQEKIINNKSKINDCIEIQNGICMFENCKQSIYIVLNAKGSWSGQLRFLGVCEKHFEENIKKQNKEDQLLGIIRY